MPTTFLTPESIPQLKDEVRALASEQPASRSGSRTVFSGLRIEAVSAMKWTPQKAMTSSERAAAWRESPSESPT